MEKRPIVSFAIAACNESVELDRLLNQLGNSDLTNCEIVILLDDDSVTPEVLSVIEDCEILEGTNVVKVFRNSLNKDFAQHKNVLNSHCSSTWILQLDADEFLHDFLLDSLKDILDVNGNIDAIWISRINTVEGLTQEDVNSWRWHLNDKGWINFPDRQLRLYKNRPEIKWTKPVHEQLIGYTTWSELPAEEKFALYHPKEIGRQRKQNAFYDTI